MRTGANIEFVALRDVSGLFPFEILFTLVKYEDPPPNNMLTVPLPTYTSKACSLDLLVN